MLIEELLIIAERWKQYKYRKISHGVLIEHIIILYKGMKYLTHTTTCKKLQNTVK